MTDQEAYDLFTQGMPLEELINCFKDDKERTSLYVSTMLTYKDMDHIVYALEKQQEISSLLTYQEMQNSTAVFESPFVHISVDKDGFITLSSQMMHALKTALGLLNACSNNEHLPITSPS